MKCGILFSGGKDSAYAAYLTKQKGHQISCLISIISKNTESYMFHTPSITKVKVQSERMKIPIIIKDTQGKKEEELKDLEDAIKNAIIEYNVEAIITGSVESAYQASRIQKICDTLDLECFNPLWQKDQIELLYDLIKLNFDVITTGVFAYPLGEDWLGRKINKKFIEDIKYLNNKYKINPAGEGGEYETYVLNCPLFYKKIKIKNRTITGDKNSWKMEIEVK